MRNTVLRRAHRILHLPLVSSFSGPELNMKIKNHKIMRPIRCCHNRGQVKAFDHQNHIQHGYSNV